MFFLPLGIVSLIASVITFAWTKGNGGPDATTTISDQVLTGTMLYAIAAALFVAGVFFIVSAIMKAIRRIAATIAIVALAGGGGIAALVPDSVSNYVGDHCTEQVKVAACDKLRNE